MFFDKVDVASVLRRHVQAAGRSVGGAEHVDLYKRVVEASKR
jgi:hypothetical protein